MGTQFILQPNGKWAIWSTISDSFLGIDYDDDNIVAEAVKEVSEKAERETWEYLKKRRTGRFSQFSVQWEDALAKGLERLREKKDSLDGNDREALVRLEAMAAEAKEGS